MMGAKVYSERQNELFKQTSVLLPKLGIRPSSFLVTATKVCQVMLLDSIIVTLLEPFLYHKL
jgi:protein-L-isoaspartate(D-aspartate) O-methyltransferase